MMSDLDTVLEDIVAVQENYQRGLVGAAEDHMAVDSDEPVGTVGHQAIAEHEFAEDEHDDVVRALVAHPPRPNVAVYALVVTATPSRVAFTWQDSRAVELDFTHAAVGALAVTGCPMWTQAGLREDDLVVSAGDRSCPRYKGAL
uniref:Uncharacterized protein n=1 Tax=Ganoderma boninense TaxID=34458 RepID=A0A5K1JZH3_9APHY|nr:Uncharacterized protein [Ganoderma boninense]